MPVITTIENRCYITNAMIGEVYKSFEVLPPKGDLPALSLSGIVPVCPAYTKLIDHIWEGKCKRKCVASLCASMYVLLLRVRRILLVRHPGLPIADRICNELQKTIFRAYWLSFQIGSVLRHRESYRQRILSDTRGIHGER